MELPAIKEVCTEDLTIVTENEQHAVLPEAGDSSSVIHGHDDEGDSIATPLTHVPTANVTTFDAGTEQFQNTASDAENINCQNNAQRDVDNSIQQAESSDNQEPEHEVQGSLAADSTDKLVERTLDGTSVQEDVPQLVRGDTSSTVYMVTDETRPGAADVTETQPGITGTMDYRQDTVDVNPWHSDTSCSSTSDEDSDVMLRPMSSDDNSDENDAPKKGSKNKQNRFPVTKGELLISDLPPIEDLAITVDENVHMVEVGKVLTIVDALVIVQAQTGERALDMSTILFLEERKVLGQVFETFGPVSAPLYSVRYNSREQVDERGISPGLVVYYAPEAPEFTHYVFMEHLKHLKGSDASWENNNEPPMRFLDYSDDEEERKAKSERKHKKNTMETPEMEPSTKKRNSWKPKESNKEEEVEYNGGGEHSWPPKTHSQIPAKPSCGILSENNPGFQWKPRSYWPPRNAVPSGSNPRFHSRPPRGFQSQYRGREDHNNHDTSWTNDHQDHRAYNPTHSDPSATYPHPSQYRPPSSGPYNNSPQSRGPSPHETSSNRPPNPYCPAPPRGPPTHGPPTPHQTPYRPVTAHGSPLLPATNDESNHRPNPQYRPSLSGPPSRPASSRLPIGPGSFHAPNVPPPNFQQPPPPSSWHNVAHENTAHVSQSWIQNGERPPRISAPGTDPVFGQHTMPHPPVSRTHPAMNKPPIVDTRFMSHTQPPRLNENSSYTQSSDRSTMPHPHFNPNSPSNSQAQHSVLPPPGINNNMNEFRPSGQVPRGVSPPGMPPFCNTAPQRPCRDPFYNSSTNNALPVVPGERSQNTAGFHGTHAHAGTGHFQSQAYAPRDHGQSHAGDSNSPFAPFPSSNWGHAG